MFDLNDPRFKPLWLRITLTVAALGWGAFEILTGSLGFGLIFLAVGAYAGYRFFITFNPRDKE